jgi:hypothetical protein
MAPQNGRKNNMLQTLIKVKSRGFSVVRRGRILHAKLHLQKPLLQKHWRPVSAADRKVKKT